MPGKLISEIAIKSELHLRILLQALAFKLDHLLAEVWRQRQQLFPSGMLIELAGCVEENYSAAGFSPEDARSLSRLSCMPCKQASDTLLFSFISLISRTRSVFGISDDLWTTYLIDCSITSRMWQWSFARTSPCILFQVIPSDHGMGVPILCPCRYWVVIQINLSRNTRSIPSLFLCASVSLCAY